jgi:hypothetical protein
MKDETGTGILCMYKDGKLVVGGDGCEEPVTAIETKTRAECAPPPWTDYAPLVSGVLLALVVLLLSIDLLRKK